jgi:hypothetical protein
MTADAKKEEGATLASQLASSLADQERAKLERDSERAKRIEKQLLEELQQESKRRSTAPAGANVTRDFSESRRDRLARMYWPESIEEHADRLHPTRVTKPATLSVGWSPPQDRRKMIDNGWRPAIIDGEHLSDGGDLCYLRDIRIKRAQRTVEKELRDSRFVGVKTIAEELGMATRQKEYDPYA